MKYLEKRNDLAVNALKKLSSEERAALVSTIVDIATVKQYEDKKIKPQNAKLNRIIAEMEKKLAERFKLVWLAADGSEFDNYDDYHNHQWGGLLR